MSLLRDPFIVVGISAAIILIAGLAILLNTVIPVLFVGLIAFCFGWKYFYLPYKEEEERAQWEGERKLEILLSIRNHGATLHRKYQQACWIDDYGLQHTEKAEAEIHYFLKKVLEMDRYAPLYDWAYEIIQEKMNTAISDGIPETEDIDIEAMEPLEFEHHCARVLSQRGWIAYPTKGSGDQGTDVIAEKDGLRVVIQCKLYSKPVGNSAVQEINAGKTYEQAKVACVVTNSSYTQSARRLAQATGVLLLHYQDLPNLSACIQTQATLDPSLQKA